MKIVLVKSNNGDSVEAEAFKNIDSFNDWLCDTFPDSYKVFMEKQKRYLIRNLPCHNYRDNEVVIDAYINYELF